MGKKWSKKRAEAWGRQFIEETEVVPSSSLRRNYNGPDDQTLIDLYGGVRVALETWGAPLAIAKTGGPSTYDHANGHLTGQKEKKERVRNIYPMTVYCSLCEEFPPQEFPTAREALVAQKQHLEESHADKASGPTLRWKNPPDSLSVSEHRPHAKAH